MPKIVIWMPHDENQAGHVAIATNEYYVSFWPANCLEKDGKQTRRFLDGVDFALELHEGCLVFHEELDKEYEGGFDPDEHEIDAAKVSNEDLNAVIEEFLHYNGINPEDVTLARGKEKYEEYKELSALMTQEEAERIEDLPVKSLAETKYSIMAELVSSKDDDSAPFYNRQQSCVSFAFNLIQMAWLKHRPDRPIPIVNYEEAKNASEIPISYLATVYCNFFFIAKQQKESTYKVPWFEREVVRRYLITDQVNNQPIIPVQSRIENELRQVKSYIVSFFVLLLLGYLFPETRYPNLFIFWNSFGEDEVMGDDPSILRYFIFPLIITSLAHHNWCGIVRSVVIFHLVGVSFHIMESYLLGEFWGELNGFFIEGLSTVYRGNAEKLKKQKELGRKSS